MSSPPQYTSEQLDRDPRRPPSPSHVVDAFLRMAASESATAQGGDILGYEGGFGGYAERRRLNHSDEGALDPVWEHYQHAQRQGHFGERNEESRRKGKGHGKGKYSQGGKRRSSGGSPGNDWSGSGIQNVNRGRKGSGRSGGNICHKTYTPKVAGGMLDLENVPVTDEEWGEGALMLTQDSPPLTTLSGEDAAEFKLPRVPEHAPAPQLAPLSSPLDLPLLPPNGSHSSSSRAEPSQQLDVDPDVLRATLEALSVGSPAVPSAETPASSHEIPVHEDSAEPNHDADATTGGPRLRVDKEAAMRIICHYAGLRRPRKPTNPPTFPSGP